MHFKDLTVPIILLVAFWAIGVIFWQIKDRAFFLYNFGIIGTSLFIGFGLYAILPRKKKPIGRKVAQALVGLYMMTHRPRFGDIWRGRVIRRRFPRSLRRGRHHNRNSNLNIDGSGLTD